MQNWRRLGRTCAWLSALALLSASLSGCTLIGAGVGAGIDSLIPGPYQERPPAELVRLERNERVVVLLRNGTRVTGRYLGTHGPTAADLDRYLLVNADKDLVSVRTSDVSSIAVEVTGKGWLYGGLIGLTADVVVVVLGVISMSNMNMDFSLSSNGCFC